MYVHHNLGPDRLVGPKATITDNQRFDHTTFVLKSDLYMVMSFSCIIFQEISPTTHTINVEHLT